MATALRTEIIIKATPLKIWVVFTDFAAYPEWNPFIRSLEGTPATGSKLEVFLVPPGGKGMKFRPQVLKADAGKEFRWLGRLFVPGIFDGEHYFQLHDNGDGTTTFVQGEDFRGLLVPFMKSMLEGGTKNGFTAMNEALKNRCEQVTADISRL